MKQSANVLNVFFLRKIFLNFLGNFNQVLMEHHQILLLILSELSQLINFIPTEIIRRRMVFC